MSRKYHPKDVLHEYCFEREMPCVDIPEDDITRVGLVTNQYTANVGFQFDPDGNGYQTFAPLGRLSPNDEASRGCLANAIISNHPREVVPYLSPEGVFVIEVSKSGIPVTKAGIKRGFDDVFGRVALYVEDVLPLIQNLLDENGSNS